MSVRRFTVTLDTGLNRVTKSASVVLASDYDALAASRDERSAQLIEAERRNVALAARIAELEAALRKIQQWDMLNPLNGDYVFCDGPWLKKLVNDALTQSETSSKPDDPNAPFRWICIHCTTVNAVDTDVCVGCRKPRYPTLHSDRAGKP